MNKKKQNYLVIQNQEVFDGHGSGDFAGEFKFVSDSEIWEVYNPEKYYSDEIEDFNPNTLDEDETLEDVLKEMEIDEDNLHEEDGYNCIYSTYKVRKITEEEAEVFTAVIITYNKLR